MSLPLLGGVAPWAADAVLAGWLVALPAAAIGLILYFRRMSMLPDALAHVALPGVAGAYLVGGGPSPTGIFGGALGSGVLAAAVIGWLTRRRGVRSDAAIGAVFPLFFAAGVVMVSTVGRRVHLDLNCVLFGNLLGVGQASMATLAIAAVGVCVLTGLLWRPWVYATFDPQHARSQGVPAGRLDAALLAAAAVVAVAGFDAVGAVLVVAFFVLPALAAHAVCDSMRAALCVALAHGLTAVLGGVAIAMVVDAPPAGLIVCVGATLTLAATLTGRWFVRPRAHR